MKPGELLEEIRKYANARDHEAAHALEQDLWEVVLLGIADGTMGKREAELALESRFIDFHRWFA